MENLAAGDQEKLMHISLPISENVLLHGTDALESRGHTLVIGNNFNVMIEAESKEEAEKLFHKLSTGGKIDMPLQDTFWGAYFGSFTDQFGIQWMVNYTYSQK